MSPRNLKFEYSKGKSSHEFTYATSIKEAQWTHDKGIKSSTFSIGQVPSVPSWQESTDISAPGFDRTWDWVFLTTSYDDLNREDWEDWG